ncbi:hypothetical protein QZH41_001405 [Actinostola sp. cb2023]|nr:hypothetical protein QZH41_001405 [Actinostola sp. cb2023]
MTSSIYDPLGFISPYVLPAKFILQDLCRQGFGWDDPVPEREQERWNQWLEELPKLKELEVNRCLKPKSFGEVVSAELHNFSDASQLGYGAVSYLRLVNGEGIVHCAFIMGKSRLTPIKQVTIPRLERRQAPLGDQKMADLPVDRVTPDRPPFTSVGVDCFGPFLVKRGRTEVKRYGIVFTCLAIRAIHIEVLHSMDTTSFVNSFRRFIARRGMPELLPFAPVFICLADWDSLGVGSFLLDPETVDQRNFEGCFKDPEKGKVPKNNLDRI